MSRKIFSINKAYSQKTMKAFGGGQVRLLLPGEPWIQAEADSPESLFRTLEFVSIQLDMMMEDVQGQIDDETIADMTARREERGEDDPPSEMEIQVFYDDLAQHGSKSAEFAWLTEFTNMVNPG